MKKRFLSVSVLLTENQDYGGIFPILSKGGNGDFSHFIQFFSKYIPGFCEIALI